MVKLIKENNNYSEIQEDCEEVLGEILEKKIQDFLNDLSVDVLDNLAYVMQSKVEGYDVDWCAEEETNFSIPNQYVKEQIADVLTSYIMSDLFYNKDNSRWKKQIKFNL